MTSFVPLDEAASRKRKQEPSSLSDYIYSSPNSPSHPMNLPTDMMDHSYSFGLDSMMTTFEYPPANNEYQSIMQHPIEHMQGFNNSRRHSVAVGELDYQHYHLNNNNNNNNNNFSGFVKQEPLDGVNWNQTDLQQLSAIGGGVNGGHPSLPSSFSSHSSSGTFDSMNGGGMEHPPMAHQRTMSLRLGSLSSSSSYDQTAASASPTTPVFFASNFLDSLSTSTEEDGNSFTNHSFVDAVSASTDMSHQQLVATSVPDHQLGLPADFMVHPDQLAMQSSVLSNTTNQQPQQQYNYHQQQQQPEMWMMDTNSTPTTTTTTMTQTVKRQSISKRRASTKSNKSPPPSSPTTTMSTSSPSPPITPSQQLNGFESFHHHRHPSIPEEDDDTTFGTNTRTGTATSNEKNDQVMERRVSAERRAKNSLVSARIIQGENTATQLKPWIQQYLLSNDPSACGEHSVTLLTSKVAQKSYGTEKRFLCPPPTTILTGASWWTTNVDGQQDTNITTFYPTSSGTLCTPKLTIHISGESTSQDGTLEWCNANGSVIDNTSTLAATAHASHLGETTMTGKCVSKQLHINDADEKRRRVEVLAKIQLGNNIQLGTLASKGIKVISKPSKKRQSLKNMELCIHHGTTVSLFNRIRSQTVSTKYLGVSNGNASPGNNGNNTGTCFVARTGSWDPFVIWIVDTSRSPESVSSTPRMLHHPLNPDFPPPPAIAMQTGISHQSPVALHYNQPVVLQCTTTGLVSPVMIIRKVDKGSAVLGGNRVEDLTGMTGGECGDEALGDPVSQLHKIAFQIVQDPSMAYTNKANYQSHPYSAMGSSACTEWTLPQTSHPVSYLACLNDVVGVHKTTTMRTLVSTRPPTSPISAPLPPWNVDMPTYNININNERRMSSVISSQIEAAGKVVRKRRVSCDVVNSGNNNNNKFAANHFGKSTSSNNQRRRVNSLNDVPTRTTLGTNENTGRRGSLADRRLSISSDNGNPVDGSCWTEDVSDAAVWTLVGTDIVKYTFWTPPAQQQQQQDDTTTPLFNNPFARSQNSHPITPFPLVNQVNAQQSSCTMLITGENLSRDLSVWFGDIKAPLTEYKSRDLLSCTVPDDSVLATSMVVTTDEECPNLRKLPLLLVRGDGVVYRTGEFYTF